jgi:hypothetical protein
VFAGPGLEDGRYLAGAALAFYLSNRSRAMWRGKPDGELNIGISLEQLVFGSLKLEESDKSNLKSSTTSPQLN